MIALGVCMALLAYVFARHQEQQRIEAQFLTSARDRVLSLQQTITLYREQVESLADFHAADRAFDRASYRAFVTPRLARRQGISSLEWIPRVPDAERAAYESRARRDGFPRFQFTQRLRQGVMVRADRRPVYYPVYYQEPLVEDGIALGFDLGSNPQRLAALTTAAETGTPAASARLILVEEKSGRYSVLLFHPVYHGNPRTVAERRSRLAGFGLGVFRIGDLVEEALGNLEPQALSVSLYDESAPPGERFLYHSPADGRAPEEAARHAEAAPLRASFPLDMGGRRWTLAVSATPAYLQARRSIQPLALPLALLCLTAVIAAWLRAEILRRERVEALADELRQANRELREETEERLRVQDALRESELRLVQSQKMESIGRLAGGVAHDFNNFLTAVFACLDSALLKLPPGSPAAGDLVHARQGADRAAALTRQLLTFARKQPVEPHVVSVDDVVAGIEPMLRRLIGADVELSVRPYPELGNARVDPAQLELVLVNLAVNARDAMPGGGRLILQTANVTLDEEYVRTCPEAQPGEHVMLAVMDTGEGMPPEVLEHVFEPFFTTKAPGEGTGLGLATCFGIIRQNGGHVTVQSQPGRGTAFRIYFPRVYDPREARRAEEPLSNLPGGTETVLVVEDEPLVRGIAHEFLAGRGYRVLEASNGEEALRRARAHDGPIDLLITDVVMPRMGGPEMVADLRPERPDLKVIYVSGYSEGTAHPSRDADATFLQKPFTLVTLARTVRRVLDADDRAS